MLNHIAAPPLSSALKHLQTQNCLNHATAADSNCAVDVFKVNLALKVNKTMDKILPGALWLQV